MVERGRVKCGQYWPLEEGRTEQHGYFLVRNTHIQVFQDFKLSYLELYNTQVSETINNVCIDVYYDDKTYRNVLVVELLFFFLYMYCIFLSPARDERCVTTCMSAGQTLGCLRALRLCWTFVNMYFRGRKRLSRTWALVGWGLRGALQWLSTVVLVLDAQVYTHCTIMYKYSASTNVCSTYLYGNLCFFTRHILYTGHLPVTSRGHKHNRCPSDSETDAHTEGF